MEHELNPSEASRPAVQNLPPVLQDCLTNPLIIHDLAIAVTEPHQKAILTAFSDISADELNRTYAGLFQAAASEEPGWTQDQRDAALTISVLLAPILTAVPQLDRRALVKNYVATVAKLDPSADYFGAPHSLHEMGTVAFTALGHTEDVALSYQSRMEVREAWSKYYPEINDEHTRKTAKELVETLTDTVLPVQQTVTERWEWQRNKPEMSDETTILHDGYMSEVRTKRSFKPYMIKHTPGFQDYIIAKGSTVEEFWNLSHPTDAVKAINTIRSNPDLGPTIERFDKLFASRYPEVLTEETKEQTVAAMADQVFDTLEEVRDQLLLSKTSPQDAYVSLASQVHDAMSATKPSKKLRPVRKLLDLLELPSFGSATELDQAVATDVYALAIAGYFSARNAKVDIQLAALETLLPPKQYFNLTFMDRTEEDLYGGDDTSDCTAYHLASGFNGWTTPHWMTNPAFNQAYITIGKARVAKLGILLAEDESGLRLVVDSIETSKNIADPPAALFAISSGIDELQQWADDRGYGDVIFCTYTNSSELMAELPVETSKKQPETLQIAADGLGLDEVWQQILGQPTGEINAGYLQSSAIEETDNDPDAGYFNLIDSPELQLLTSQLERLLTVGTSDELTLAARMGDETDVVRHFVRIAAPNIYLTFGDNVSLYMRSTGEYDEDDKLKSGPEINLIIAQQIRELKLADAALQGFLHGKELKSQIKDVYRKHDDSFVVESLEALENPKRFSQLEKESIRIDDLVNCLDSFGSNAAVQTALSRIFGVVAVTSNNSSGTTDTARFPLRTNLPIIKRH